MSSSPPFHVTEHVIDGQYIREYPRATATPDAPLKLSVKQYTPVSNPNPQPGDVTIVAVHGTGFPKELYEPLWEELLHRSQQAGFRIRAIWMADAANQGASGILNEQNLGNDPSWYDHSRDLICMINQFRQQMPRPIIGLGHSLGAPYMTDDKFAGDGIPLILMATKRRDLWSSREEAIAKFRKMLRPWDPRVFQRWTEFGLRDLPTAIHRTTAAADTTNKEEKQAVPVTLTTSKHQEAMMYIRLNTQRHVQLGLVENQAHTTEPEDESPPPPHDPLLVPDMLGRLIPGQRCYRPEPILGFTLVPHLRPSVLYLSGAQSPLCRSDDHAKAARKTGAGFGGSGGIAYDRVRHVVIPGAGHNLPMEKVAATADELGEWIGREVGRWRGDEDRIAKGWEALGVREKSTFSPEWMEMIRGMAEVKRPSKI
ncbi:toxin biosynthesis protein [Aspergillus egyptiacus]|nr:toxin biosynthesis protein [Aspergillus egyptiacus]